MLINLSEKDITLLNKALSFTIFNTNEEEIYALQEKINEMVSKNNLDIINENAQIGDTVYHNKEKGFVIGQIQNKLIIQVQGNTYLADPKDLKEYKSKEIIIAPHIKFNEKTQKVLFEQYIKCGIYLGNVPIKINDCFVKYNTWNNALPEQQVKVIVDGNSTFVSKSQIKIFENLNDFANEDNYINGVIIDETTEEAIESILLNAIDYTNAIGDVDLVRIIRETPGGDQEMQSVPKAIVRTLSV